MGAGTAPNPSPDGDMERPARFGWIRRTPRLRPRSRDELSGANRVEVDLTEELPASFEAVDPNAESASLMSRMKLSQRRSPPRIIVAIGIVALATAFVGGITYYSAREFTRRAGDTRASEEAASFAQHSAYLATGDAFAGYLQMLRYADDPALRSQASTPEQRGAALQQFIYLNTNKVDSLAVVNRAGTVLASTDARIDDLRASEAFNSTRATLHPANSDIILPEAGKPGYVEFTAPLKDEFGSTWGILYGRADPTKLWASTLRASVDGGQNVIINNEGQFSAGVPNQLLRSSWKGVPLPNGSVRADIAGVDSICGLGPIAKETQIDHGWNVASCLPTSLIHAEADRAMGDQLLVTGAALVLAIAVAGAAMSYVLTAVPPAVSGRPPVPSIAEDVLVAEPESGGSASVPEPVEPDESTRDEPEAPDEPDPEPAALAPAELPRAITIVKADVDALRLIDAYERRNAALSVRLRDGVQSRLMIASSELESAYRLAATDPERAETLHRRAMGELESLRVRDLRAFGQELHPGLVRLGLPGALRSLQNEVAPGFHLALDVDPATDSVSDGPGRIRISSPLRLVLYRAIHEATVAATSAGATEASVSIQRAEDWLDVRFTTRTASPLDATTLDATAWALQAYGAVLSIEANDGVTTVSWSLDAPQAEAGIEAEDEEPAEVAEDTPPTPPSEEQPVRVVASPDWRSASIATLAHTDVPERAVSSGLRPDVIKVIPAESIDTTPLSARLQAVADAAAGITMTIAVDASADARTLSGDPVLSPAIAYELIQVTRIAADTLTDADARACAVAVQLEDGDVFFSITADTGGTSVDAGPFAAVGDAIEARGGFFAISKRADVVTITVEVPLDAGDEPAVIRVDVIPGALEAEDESEVEALDTAPADIAALLEPEIDSSAA